MSVKLTHESVDSQPTLSIIVPVGPHDQEWRKLLYDLEQTPEGSEIILVLPDGAEPLEPDLFSRQYNLSRHCCRVITSPQGRGFQLNSGALAACGDLLWFLHADSRFHRTTVNGLKRHLSRPSIHALFYFSLRFLPDGPVLMKLNELGARIRSRLGLPFGDQGFLISRELFLKLEGFPHDVTWGEDHAFVWRCHVSGIPVKPIGAALYTSARTYQINGWTRTSYRYVSATAHQVRRFSKHARAWYACAKPRKDTESEEKTF